MATVRDIVVDALRKLGVVSEGIAPTAYYTLLGVNAYNDMLFGWEQDGLSYSKAGVAYSHAEQKQGDEFPLDDGHIEGVKALLAVKLAPEIAAEPPPVIVAQSVVGWNRLAGAYYEIPDIKQDSGLLFGENPTHRVGR